MTGKPDTRLQKIEGDIGRLEAGEAVIIGGESDIQHVRGKIEELRGAEPSLASELDTLGTKLDGVDPSLSTWEARKARGSGQVGLVADWNALPRDALQVAGIGDAADKTSFKITIERAQEIVDEQGLKDGIYTLKDRWGEVYMVVRDGSAGVQVFTPPDYDIGYLMRGSRDLKHEGTINV